MAQAPHVPTEEMRALVRKESGHGVPQTYIATLIGIDPTTLRAHYRADLDQGKAEAHAKISGTLFEKAMAGDTASAIFWAKTQMGWRETVKVEHTGDVGLSLKSASELRAAIRGEGQAPSDAVDAHQSGAPDASDGMPDA